MNTPADLFQVLQQYLWNQDQEAAQWDQTSTALKSFAHDFAFGIGLPVAVAAVLLIAALLLYQPRIPRGALWLPVFGLFGGTPKLYLHTRPPSFFGLFLKSRHRTFAFRKRK